MACRTFNPFPNKPWFLRVCSTSLLKTLWEKEKLLVTSNFSFSRSVFYSFGELSAVFIKYEIVICKVFHFGPVYNLLFGKGLRYTDLDEWEIPKDQTGKRLRPAQYVVPPLNPSTESDSGVNRTRSNKLADRQLRDQESSQSEDNIPLAELQNRTRSRQARLKYEDKHIPVEYDTSTESYFSDSVSDD